MYIYKQTVYCIYICIYTQTHTHIYIYIYIYITYSYSSICLPFIIAVRFLTVTCLSFGGI